MTSFFPTTLVQVMHLQHVVSNWEGVHSAQALDICELCVWKSPKVHLDHSRGGERGTGKVPSLWCISAAKPCFITPFPRPEGCCRDAQTLYGGARPRVATPKTLASSGIKCAIPALVAEQSKVLASHSAYCSSKGRASTW